MLEALAMAGYAATVFNREVAEKAERDAMVATVREAMDEAYNLIYLDYRDQFTDEQAQAWLTDDYEYLYDSISEWESDMRYEQARHEYNELLKSLDIDEFEMGRQGEFDLIEEIAQRDISDPIGDLVRNSWNKLFRATIVGSPDEDCGEVREVVWYGSLKDAKEVYKGGTFDFTGARVLTINHFYGYGGDDEGDAGILTVVRGSATLDVMGAGYSWTEIAGPSPLSYVADPVRVSVDV